eukprot:gene51-12868_t
MAAASASSAAVHSAANTLGPHFASQLTGHLLSGFHHHQVHEAALMSVAQSLPVEATAAGLDTSLLYAVSNINAISSSILDSFSWLSSSDPDVMPMMQSALDELSQAVTLGFTSNSSASGELLGYNSSIFRSFASSTAVLQGILQSPLAGGEGDVAARLAKLTSMAADLQGNKDAASLAILSASILASIAASDPGAEYRGPVSLSDDMQLDNEYSAEYLEARASEVAAECIRIGAALLSDRLSNRVAENEAVRASQLRGAIERLGPAYVKVAQALSTRSDLLSPAYFEQIQLLQDRVQPFDCEIALRIIEESQLLQDRAQPFNCEIALRIIEESQLLQDRAQPFNCEIALRIIEERLGRPLNDMFVSIFDKPVASASLGQRLGRPLKDMFVSISDKPVASASLGQVYRATTTAELGGRDVAIKVQRPGVLAHLSLDLYLMRKLAKSLGGNEHKLDYTLEASYAAELARDMECLPGIVIVDTLPQLSCQNVITTSWVEGMKLSDSDASDVRTLCTTLLNAYLVQLLETGLLHADPHPGNLIRTTDGRICILDYGLLTRVSLEQRWSLIEFITHLVTLNWEKVAIDLQNLGFIPPGYDIEESGLVVPLSRIMKALVAGGGAKNINVQELMGELTDLGRIYSFQIPPFFVSIIRTFTVIEGIALKVDPDYAMIQECLPYLSRRLLCDTSPRAQKALHDLLYGERKRLNIRRLARMSSAFSNYSTSALTSNGRVVTPAANYSSPFDTTPSSTSPPSSSSSSPPSPSPSRDNSATEPRGPDITQSFPVPVPSFASAALSSFSGIIDTTGSVVLSVANIVGGVVPALSIVALGPPSNQPPLIDLALKDGLVTVLSSKGSYLQELLVEEMVSAVDVVSRETLCDLLKQLSKTFPVQFASAAVGSMPAFVNVPVPFASVALGSMPAFVNVPVPVQVLDINVPVPFASAAVGSMPAFVNVPVPVQVLGRVTSSIAVTEEDEEALGVATLQKQHRGVADAIALWTKNVDKVDGKTLPQVAMEINAPTNTPTQDKTPNNFQVDGKTLPQVDGKTLPKVDGKTLPQVAMAINELVPMVPELAPGMLHMGDLFFRGFVRRAALRIAEGLKDEASSEYESAMGFVRRAALRIAEGLKDEASSEYESAMSAINRSRS